MRRFNILKKPRGWLGVGVLLGFALFASRAGAADFGRVSGKVTDTGGTPLMGATVLLTSSGLDVAGGIERPVERVLTNGRGDFSINHLAPGWYSLQVISPTRLPVFRKGVRVNPNETTQETFALSDIFSQVRWQDPKPNFHSWGDEWKWILRTSSATRPILRYAKTGKAHRRRAGSSPLPVRRLIAVIPGSALSDALSSDPGMGTVVAYLHPLDENSDVLVAGSMSSGSMGGTTFAASYRQGISEKDQQEISLVVHRLSLQSGLPVSIPEEHGLADSQGMVLHYVQSRQLSSALTLTAGFEVRYLNSVQDAKTVHPEASLAYRFSPATLLTLSYGTMETGQASTMLDRVGRLNGFPRISLRDHRPFLEDATHAEVRLDRSLNATSRIEIAAYRDGFRNMAVWGTGGVQNLDNMVANGNVLLNLGGSTAVLNGGGYRSAGVRFAYKRDLGHHTEMGIMYAFGDALGVGLAGDAGEPVTFNPGNLASILRSQFTQTVSGKFSVRIPSSKTQIITTYAWLPTGRVTVVDPYGEGRMEVQPFLGFQIRQPLPRIDALPVRIVALADFRNVLGQGSVSLGQRDGGPFFLTPAYRTVRGGFAVQF
jgi:Carboxypeptidase regulatory-like domain